MVSQASDNGDLPQRKKHVQGNICFLVISVYQAVSLWLRPRANTTLFGVIRKIKHQPHSHPDNRSKKKKTDLRARNRDLRRGGGGGGLKAGYVFSLSFAY